MIKINGYYLYPQKFQILKMKMTMILINKNNKINKIKYKKIKKIYDFYKFHFY